MNVVVVVESEAEMNVVVVVESEAEMNVVVVGESEAETCVRQHTSIYFMGFENLIQTLQHQFSCLGNGVELLGWVGGEVRCSVMMYARMCVSERKKRNWAGKAGEFHGEAPSETHFRVAIASAKGISSPNAPPCTLEWGRE